jgi:hypothetical protein
LEATLAALEAKIRAAGPRQKEEKPRIKVPTGVNQTYQIPKFLASNERRQGNNFTSTFAPGYVDYQNSMGLGFLDPTLDPTIRDKVVSAAKGDQQKYDSIYKLALWQTATEQQAGNTDITMASLLDDWIANGVPEQGSGRGGGSAGGSFSSTNRSISLTDSGTANQIINRALSAHLGREASDLEQRRFLKALNVMERRNPTISKTTGYADGKGNQNSKTITTGGFNQADYADRFAKSQEGYAEFQAGTTYLDMFMKALENPTRVI